MSEDTGINVRFLRLDPPALGEAFSMTFTVGFGPDADEYAPVDGTLEIPASVITSSELNIVYSYEVKAASLQSDDDGNRRTQHHVVIRDTPDPSSEEHVCAENELTIGPEVATENLRFAFGCGMASRNLIKTHLKDGCVIFIRVTDMISGLVLEERIPEKS